jgi:hypothetical protein
MGGGAVKDVDMDLLYEAAVLAAAIRGMYAQVKTHPNARYFVYVLLLQHGKLYVGSTDNPYVRLADHFACSPSSAAWVREWGPPVRVIEMVRDATLDDEHYKYAEYADKFGWDAVRGGGCCRVMMSHEPPSVKMFARRPNDSFQYLSRAEINDIVSKVTQL